MSPVLMPVQAAAGGHERQSIGATARSRHPSAGCGSEQRSMVTRVLERAASCRMSAVADLSCCGLGFNQQDEPIISLGCLIHQDWGLAVSWRALMMTNDGWPNDRRILKKLLLPATSAQPAPSQDEARAVVYSIRPCSGGIGRRHRAT